MNKAYKAIMILIKIVEVKANREKFENGLKMRH